MDKEDIDLIKDIYTVVVQSLEEEQPSHAASSFLGLYEQYLEDKGVPPGHVCYCAFARASKNPDENFSTDEIDVQANIDVAAVFNGVPEKSIHNVAKHANIILHSTIESLDDWCDNSWHKGNDSEYKRKKDLTQTFKISIAAVSFARQWACYFGENQKGPRDTKQPLEMWDHMSNVPAVGNLFSQSKTLQAIFKYLMDGTEYLDD